jgi:hypothetical protein
MRQTTLGVPLEVKPESYSALSALIEEVKRREDAGTPSVDENFDRLVHRVPGLHFMSMSVFPGAEYDPLFILEANFDGDPGPFWSQLEALIGDCLRKIICCCKRPLDEDGPLYDAVTRPDSKSPVAAYLEARTQRPSVFHHGNRGLSRPQILDERALFRDVRDALDAEPPAQSWHNLAAPAVHQALRGQLLPKHPWLAQPAPQRISAVESATDYGRLAAFIVATLVVLVLPGLVASALLTSSEYLDLDAALVVLLAILLYFNRHGLPGTELANDLRLGKLVVSNAGKLVTLVILVIFGLVATCAVVTGVVWLSIYLLHQIGLADGVAQPNIGMLFCTLFDHLARGLLSLVAALLALIYWLRRNEKRDSTQEAALTDEGTLREMLRREDWVAQNHMGSIVLIKPGILRTIIIRAGHLGLGLVLRIAARDGYLGSMRTVHFAHWAFLNNGSRLLFMSNFDHSWGSYLDDFIEKAHGGLTLAWGCGVGFPPTRFLVYDGASHGRLFKAWALASRTVTRFWFSAYPDLTVDQIERNNRLANGLRKPHLTAEEAKAWCLDL